MEPLIETIKRLTDARKAAKVTPTYVCYYDLQAERIRLLREELNDMALKGVISVSKTLNDKGIALL